MAQLRKNLIQNYLSANHVAQKGNNFQQNEKVISQKLNFESSQNPQDTLIQREDATGYESSESEGLASPQRIEDITNLDFVLADQTSDSEEQNADYPVINFNQEGYNEYLNGSISDMDKKGSKGLFKFEKSIPKIFVHDQL